MARNSNSRPPSTSEVAPRVRQALRLLSEELRNRLERHPWGHLLAGGTDTLSLDVKLPTSLRDEGAAQALAAAASEALDDALKRLLTHHATLRPGTVYCLRCETTECEHSRPTDPRQVFAGFGKTGIPRFQELGQLLLERGDTEVHRLYKQPPRVLARWMRGRDLTTELLEPYGDPDSGYRIHGQVVAGWYSVPDPSGRPHTLAITLQVVSSRPRGSRERRWALNVLGLGPEGEPLEHLYDRLGTIPWTDAVRWAQSALDTFPTKVPRRRKPAGKTSSPTDPGGETRDGEAPATGSKDPLTRRVEGLLAALARRLAKLRRARERKTRHARRRHAQGDRPTPMALPDLARAGRTDILVDERSETFVVLGERGRAHVFSPAGKHVTSVRYTPEAITKRKERGYWRPAFQEEIQQLRSAVESASR